MGFCWGAGTTRISLPESVSELEFNKISEIAAVRRFSL